MCRHIALKEYGRLEDIISNMYTKFHTKTIITFKVIHFQSFIFSLS